jgi:hypothetical protein
MEVARGVFLRCPWTHGRRRDARWPALVLLAVLAWPDAASADLSWPLSDYNPRSLPDDLLLPLPCGGAMAFRPVPTGGPPGGKANLPPGLHWLLDVQGSFPGGDGQGAYFLMGKYEVNARQYRAVRAAAEGRPCPAVAAAASALPMVDIRRADAAAFAEALSAWWVEQAKTLPDCAGGASPCLPRLDETVASVRLPTEAEWEYATRAGTPTPFWTGNCIDTSQANYNGWFDYAGCGAETGLFRNAPVPAGSLPANPFGLHEVHGNLGEWTADCWRDSLVDPVGGDPAAVRQDCSRHVLRGGFFDHKPHLMRSANRFGVAAGIRREDIGFRVARDL